MALEDNLKRHFTVLVKVVEVQPSYRTGSGVQAITHERQTDEVLMLSIRSGDFESAVNQAIGLLETAREGRDE